MPEEILSLDPANPGMFYACCGALEVVGRNEPEAEGHFEVVEPRLARFVVRSTGGGWLARIEESICGAAIEPCEVVDGLEAIRPVEIGLGALGSFRVNWWLNWTEGDKGRLKTWSGNQSSVQILSGLVKVARCEGGGELLLRTAYTQTKMGVDPRPAWNALDYGYSPNEHAQKSSLAYPITELLACIGLQGFRPGLRKKRFEYALWMERLNTQPARLAAGGGWQGLPASTYRFEIERRGKYGCFQIAQPKPEQE